MKPILAALICLMVCVVRLPANDTDDKQLRELCIGSDAIVHIRVEATANIVDKVSLIKILKKSDSLPGEAGVRYALSIKRPGERITRSDWRIQHPGDYVVFCKFPVGDFSGIFEASITTWSLYKDNDSRVRQVCDSINAAEKD